MDYEAIIREKFPKCEVEVITPDVFELEKLVEYITDDIVVYKPHNVMCYRHMIRFLMNVGQRGKIYYLDGFSDEEMKLQRNDMIWLRVCSCLEVEMRP